MLKATGAIPPHPEVWGLSRKKMKEFETGSPKIKLYGKTGAIGLEYTRNNGVKTINIDLAPKPDKVNVDWANKLSFQLSYNEMVEVSGVLSGYLQKYYVARSDKGVTFERQQGKVFVSGTSMNERINVPVDIGGCQKAGEYFIARLLESSVSGDMEALLVSLKGAWNLNRS